jgi:hypothetical protein
MVVAAPNSEYEHSVMVATLTTDYHLRTAIIGGATFPRKPGTYPDLFHADAMDATFFLD